MLISTDWLHVSNHALDPAGECIDAVSGELTFFTLPNCFELFGFDLMVDDQWHVWLLEVSALSGRRLRLKWCIVTSYAMLLMQCNAMQCSIIDCPEA